MEKQKEIKAKTTLVRRVSDLFRADGKGAVSPLLLNRTSIQKLRHCCQNLNLFPILFYTFDQAKAPKMPISKLKPSLLMARIVERIYRVYLSITYTIIRGLGLKSVKSSHVVTTITSNDKNVKITETDKKHDRERRTSVKSTKLFASSNEREFKKFTVQKPKRNSLLLKFAVYSAPLLLAFQVIGLLSLTIFGKFSAGFVFLFSALIFLGCISMKVLYHDATAIKTRKSDKRKND